MRTRPRAHALARSHNALIFLQRPCPPLLAERIALRAFKSITEMILWGKKEKKDEIKSQAGPVGGAAGAEDVNASLRQPVCRGPGGRGRGPHPQTREDETQFTCFQHRSFDDGHRGETRGLPLPLM